MLNKFVLYTWTFSLTFDNAELGRRFCVRYNLVWSHPDIPKSYIADFLKSGYGILKFVTFTYNELGQVSPFTKFPGGNKNPSFIFPVWDYGLIRGRRVHQLGTTDRTVRPLQKILYAVTPKVHLLRFVRQLEINVWHKTYI